MFDKFSTDPRYVFGLPATAEQVRKQQEVVVPQQRQERVFVLDGYRNGITAFIYSENALLKPLNVNGGKQKYFTNYEILESTLRTQGYDKLNYKILFILDNGHYEFPIEDVFFNKLKGGWEAWMEDDKHVEFDALIKPKYVESVTSIGYIVNSRSNNKLVLEKRSPKFKELLTSFNTNKFNEIYDIVKNSVGLMTVYPKYDVYLDTESMMDKIVIRLRGTTGKIVITSNSNIIDFNEKKRKANNLRCLPFNKDMDKHGTLYVYTTIDINENEYVKDRIYHTLLKLMDIIQESYPMTLTHYERLEFSGYILLKED